MEDEALIFTPQANSIAAQWRTMGVDYVRIQAYWNALSPGTKSPTIPAGFDPSNPNSPGYNWAPLDAAIAAVRNNGMQVMLTLNQSNPRWASTQPSKTQASWMPNPTRFAQFVTAVGRRYGQQVNRYLMLSEPNQLPFLAPQFTCRGRKCTPVAPHLARNLSNAGYTAIKSADPGAQVIVGELAPIGSPPSRTGGITPLLFLQQMGCVNKLFRPIRTGLCRGFKAVRGDGFGYHPYVNTKTSPFQATRNQQLAKIGDMPRLLSWLDTAHAQAADARLDRSVPRLSDRIRLHHVPAEPQVRGLAGQAVGVQRPVGLCVVAACARESSCSRSTSSTTTEPSRPACGSATAPPRPRSSPSRPRSSSTRAAAWLARASGARFAPTPSEPS